MKHKNIINKDFYQINGGEEEDSYSLWVNYVNVVSLLEVTISITYKESIKNSSSWKCRNCKTILKKLMLIVLLKP